MLSKNSSNSKNSPKRPRRRSKSRAIQYRSDRGRLRLVFSYGGKRHFIALGMADTPANRVKAQEIAFQVEKDIDYGEFDPTYRKYKAQAGLSTIEGVTTLSPSSISLRNLWQEYVEIRKVGKAPGTIRMYGWVANHLERCPHKFIHEAQAIFDWLTVNVPADSTRRVLTQLNACCQWASRSGKLGSSPFIGMAADIKVLPKADEEEEVHPFTRQERDRVIAKFNQDRYYKFYAPLVEFLFLTGCRPSEAIALQWKHVTHKTILFSQAVVYDGKGLSLKSGLKTQRSRKFPVNAQLAKLLEKIRPDTVDPDALVFPSRSNRFIDWHNFSNRAWKSILKCLPDVVYRNPYQTRHTFCSLCREADISSIQIAKWVGNSAQMIDRVYAKPTDHVQVPEL